MADTKKKAEETVAPAPAQVVGIEALAAALTQAIQAARPEKKTAFNRKIGTPWTPKDGSPHAKLKRRMFQHGLPMDEDILTNDEVLLCNQLVPGKYLDGHVKVNRRKDRGIDIDYPIKTAAQRLKLVNQFGVRNLKELLTMCIEESKNPRKDTAQDDDYTR